MSGRGSSRLHCGKRRRSRGGGRLFLVTLDVVRFTLERIGIAASGFPNRTGRWGPKA